MKGNRLKKTQNRQENQIFDKKEIKRVKEIIDLAIYTIKTKRGEQILGH